jgi:hypothetical protein
MGAFFGWVLIAAAVYLLVSAFRRPTEASGATPAPAPRRGPDSPYLWGGIATGVLGLALAVWPIIASAHTEAKELTRKDDWAFNPAPAPDAPIHWEGNTLVADLEAGSGRYAVYPVDWDADRFHAEWDMTVTRLDLAGERIELKVDGKPQTVQRTRQDFASIAIGLMDPSAANIDDRDHVSGSAIEACFSDDIRLRASDASFIVRTASSTESGKQKIDPDYKPGKPVPVEVNKKYHVVMEYESGSNNATLTVTDGGRAVVRLRLEDLKDFTNSIAWFGVSIRGYNRFDKKLDATKADTGYTRPRAVLRIENLQYRQPG